MAQRVASFSAFASEMSRLSTEKQQEVKNLVELTLGDIETESIASAPGPNESVATKYGRLLLDDIREGRVKGWKPINMSIGYLVNSGGLSGEVFVEEQAGEVAIWVECGTGQSAASYLASVPPEWREMAAKYIRTGKGTILVKAYFLPAIIRNEIKFKQGMDKIFR